MGEQRELGTLLAAIVSQSIEELVSHFSAPRCVDLRDGTTTIEVYLNNGQSVKIKPNSNVSDTTPC